MSKEVHNILSEKLLALLSAIIVSYPSFFPSHVFSFFLSIFLFFFLFYYLSSFTFYLAFHLSFHLSFPLFLTTHSHSSLSHLAPEGRRGRKEDGEGVAEDGDAVEKGQKQKAGGEGICAEGVGFERPAMERRQKHAILDEGEPEDGDDASEQRRHEPRHHDADQLAKVDALQLMLHQTEPQNTAHDAMGS